MKQLITLLSMSLFYIGVYAQNSIPKLLWTLKSVDSEELVGEGTINGRGTCVFDGDLSTYWHTQWQGAAPVQPHEIQLNLGASWLISGFTYTPRSGGGNGTVKGYEFYVSTDGVTWGTAVTTGTFTNTASPTTVTFTGVTGNFVRFRSTSNMQTSAYTSCAELDVLSVNAPAACTVQQIRWGTTGTPLTNLNITWRSQGTAVDSIKWGYTAAYEMGKFAGVKRTNYTDFLFTYTFAAVNAASTIHYIIKDSKTNIWTSDNTYTTAENTTTNLNGRFSFLAMGDSRDDMASWKKIANVQKTSSFTLNNGDLNFDSSGPLYDTWFAAGKSFTNKQLVLYAPGNHEVTNIANFYNQFNLPNNEQWYSFKYGNALFVVINTNDPGNATQLAWLRTTLNDNTVKWKIINFHKPFFTLGNHRNELSSGTIDYKTTIWKAFDDYGVDMIFNGHDHLYERTDPINLNVSASLKVAKYGSGASEGRFQVVTGGAGAPLYTTTADATQMVNNSQSTLNYCKVTVTTDTMYFKAYDSNNLQIDTYTFIKAAPTDILSESVALTSVNVYPNPTDEVFNIQVTNIESYTYSVYNTFGQKLFSNKVSNAQQSHVTSVNLTGFPKGIYIVEIKTAHKVITKRVLLN